MKKEMVPQPYLADMTYDENCWLIIDCRTNNDPYVSFYNPKQDKHSDFENFKEFAEIYIENEFAGFDNKQVEIKENNATVSGSEASQIEDYDEESGRVWKDWVTKGQVIEVLTGVKLEDIPEKIKQMEKVLVNVENDEVESSHEAEAERKDPYGYRGLNRRDF